MTASHVQGQVDVLREGDLKFLSARGEVPCVSVLMPTHRSGKATAQGPIRLKNLLAEASRDLQAGGMRSVQVDELLAPLVALIDDVPFWQQQADGLALFASPDRVARYRLPLALAESVSVAGSFAVRPLLPMLSSSESFYVLALTQNWVQLYEASGRTIGEVHVEDLPASMDEALAHEDPERQLQVRSGGGGTAQFHGHGAGDELDKAALERYFRAIDTGLAKTMTRRTEPLVLAAVGYYGPIFRSVSKHPRILERMIEGNPERRSASELHEEALAVVSPLHAAEVAADLDRYASAVGVGKTADDVPSVAAAAAAGRVETLFVTPGPPRWGIVTDKGNQVATTDQPSLDAEDLVGRAILDTLQARGQVHTVTSEQVPGGSDAVALLRY